MLLKNNRVSLYTRTWILTGTPHLHHEIPLLNTKLNFKNPRPPINIIEANRRIECLAILSFGHRVLFSFVVGCSTLILNAFLIYFSKKIKDTNTALLPCWFSYGLLNILPLGRMSPFYEVLTV